MVARAVRNKIDDPAVIKYSMIVSAHDQLENKSHTVNHRLDHRGRQGRSKNTRTQNLNIDNRQQCIGEYKKCACFNSLYYLTLHTGLHNIIMRTTNK